MKNAHGKLFDEHGKKTRKHTSLLIWGHNPEKFSHGGALQKNDSENSKNETESLINYKLEEILAHFSKDEALLQSFRDESNDVFKSICARWKKKAVDDVSQIERDATKQLCYAIIYGAGSSRIASFAGCSDEEAKIMYNDFLSRHPGISRFVSAVKAECRRCGYVTTLLGRRRYLKGISSQSRSEASKAERQAVNTVCQGSAADLIKVI